jgi:hypothetical protein
MSSAPAILLRFAGRRFAVRRQRCRLAARAPAAGRVVGRRAVWRSGVVFALGLLLFGASFEGHALAVDAAACGTRPENAVVRELTGYVRKVYEGDGVAIGWALDRGDSARSVEVKFYIDGAEDTGGLFAGKTLASTNEKSVNWKYGVGGDHGFAFRVPDAWRDGAQHRLYVQVVGCDGKLSSPLGPPGGVAFTLSPSTRPRETLVADTHCLDPQSRCPVASNEFLAPHFPQTRGWSDGTNYFSKWGCRSPTGYNNIARLNIIPLGTFGPHFQKDSLDVDAQPAAGQPPTLYFTASVTNAAPRWGLRKAIYNAAKDKWEIFAVFDDPSNAGGVSSGAGSGKNIIFNDYSLPGWGPASPWPGSQTKVPGVANVSASPGRDVYPLIGAGPLGLTAMTNRVYPAVSSGGVEGRTCIHMNPKLLDYDKEGVAHTLIANLWQRSPRGDACQYGDDGARLPAPGNYLYRYEGPKLGWQLDLKTGLVTDALHESAHNKFQLTPKLFGGTEHTLVVAAWDGIIETIDPGLSRSDNTQVLADCRMSHVHFGEAAGSAAGVYFLGGDLEIARDRLKYHLAEDVIPTDVYYLSKK